MTPLRRLVAAPVLVSDPDLTRLNTAQSTGADADADADADMLMLMLMLIC